jgi:competence protein ComEC
VAQLFTFPPLAALALIWGVLARSQGWPLWSLLVWLPLALWLLARPRRAALAFATLAALLGFWRMDTAQNAPDPLAAFAPTLLGRNAAGQQPLAEFVGDLDGKMLATSQGSLLLRLPPSLKLPAGRYRLRGQLAAIGGYRNPGGFDAPAFYARRGVRYSLRVREQTALPATGLAALLWPARAWLRQGTLAGLGEREAAFMLALTLGDTTGLAESEVGAGERWRDVFSKAGLGHLLALSGQQVTLLAGLFLLLLAPLGTWRYPVLMLILAGYLLLVGIQPSITRAVLMGLALALAHWLGRGRLAPLQALALSVLFGLAYEPRWLLELGAQLSVLAVLGMIVLVPPINEWVNGGAKYWTEQWPARWPRHWSTPYSALFIKIVSFVLLGLSTTIAAQLFTLPIIASSFGQIPPFAAIANLLVEPLAAVLVPLGFVAALLGPLGIVINIVIGPLVSLLLFIAQQAANLPNIPWGEISLAGFLAYSAAITALALLVWRIIRPWQALSVLLAAIIATALGRTQIPDELIYFDVGQGDASLIRLREGAILVDGGGTPQGDFDIGGQVVLPALRALGVHQLRAIIATHADADHIEGLVTILEKMPVAALIVGQEPVDPSDSLWQRLITAARERNIPIQTVRAGQNLSLGQAKLQFLWPTDQAEQADNDNSITFVLHYGAQRALFLGDLPSTIEDRLSVPTINIHKLAHHGSRFSSSLAFLGQTKPSFAVISSGAGNTYGHPAKSLLDNLQQQGITVLRTDRDGAIRYNLATNQVSVVNPGPETGLPGAAGR